MEYWELFKTFFMIGLFSFGAVPVIELKAVKYGWMTTQQFSDIFVVAGMSPGPIAANSAILVGYSVAGTPGAIISLLAMILPSLILVMIIATLFQYLNHYKVVKSMFYGLRPIVTSLIIYAAIKFTLLNNVIRTNISWHTLSLLLIFGLSLVALLKLHWHPVYVIILSGLVGITLYS